METALCKRLFQGVRIARLATVGPSGPHLVPIVFALDGDHIYTAVDHKPKRTRDLRRLANITSTPKVAVLADHYADDWSKLWWVRADGTATIAGEPPAMVRGVDLLAEKYQQYRDNPPEGPLIVIEVTTWSGWTAS